MKLLLLTLALSGCYQAAVTPAEASFVRAVLQGGR